MTQPALIDPDAIDLHPAEVAPLPAAPAPAPKPRRAAEPAPTPPPSAADLMAQAAALQARADAVEAEEDRQAIAAALATVQAATDRINRQAAREAAAREQQRLDRLAGLLAEDGKNIEAIDANNRAITDAAAEFAALETKARELWGRVAAAMADNDARNGARRALGAQVTGLGGSIDRAPQQAPLGRAQAGYVRGLVGQAIRRATVEAGPVGGVSGSILASASAGADSITLR